MSPPADQHEVRRTAEPAAGAGPAARQRLGEPFGALDVDLARVRQHGTASKGSRS